MRYLNNDELERYWFRYKSESEPHGTSLEQFCRLHGISYRAAVPGVRCEETTWEAYDVCADMDEGSMRRFVDFLLGQQEDLRLEVKAIRKLLEESESDKRALMESLEKANARMEVLTRQLIEAQKFQKESERQTQKYRELWEREKRERHRKGRRKVSARTPQDEVPADGAGDLAENGVTFHQSY